MRESVFVQKCVNLDRFAYDLSTSFEAKNFYHMFHIQRFLTTVHLKNGNFLAYGHVFSIVQNCSFFVGIDTKSVSNFIIKEGNIRANLVPFTNDVSFLSCLCLKSFSLKEETSQLFIPNRANLCCS